MLSDCGEAVSPLTETESIDPLVRAFTETGIFSDQGVFRQMGGGGAVRGEPRAAWLTTDLLCEAYNVNGENKRCVVQVVSTNGAPYEMKPPPQGEIRDMKASIRSKRVAIAQKRKTGPIALWGPHPDFRDAPRRYLFGHTVPVAAVEWSPCGNKLASVAADETTGNEQGVRRRFSFFLQKFFPMCVRSRQLEAYDNVGEVIVWDLDYLQPKVRRIIHLPLGGWEKERLESLCWSPSCAHLACGGKNTIYILDAATGVELSKAGDLITGDYPKTLLWSPKGKNGDEFLACGSTGGTTHSTKCLQMWRLKYGDGTHGHFEAVECSLPDLPSKTVVSVDWVLDSKGNLVLATASPGHGLQVWRQKGDDDPLTWECVTVHDKDGESIRWLSFLTKEGDNNPLLAVVTSDKTRLFELH